MSLFTTAISSTLPSSKTDYLPPQATNSKPSVGAALAEEGCQLTKLFSPSVIRSVKLNNRIVVSPMCMYSAQDGLFNDFHAAHYGQFAIKGAGMVIIEATAVEPRGRITPEDTGLWSDDHIVNLQKIVSLIKSQGSVPAIQIAHAGRRASVYSPFHGITESVISEDLGGWPTDIVGPSSNMYGDKYGVPKEMTEQDMEQVIRHFADAAVRANKAGIEVLEIHSAHGFLLHSFLSGNSNKRTDRFGGSFENRLRFPLAVVERVRAAWPAHKPLWVRISASDHKSNEGTIVGGEDSEGWDITHATIYAKALKKIGVDVIDVSSGGNLSGINYSAGPLYQVPFSEYIKKEVDIATGAVGIITEPQDAEGILQHNQADYILIARELLRNSGWVNRASKELQVEVKWPKQYLRANRERYLKTISANKKY